MKILHILEDYSIHSGGIRTVVKELNKRLNDIGFKSYILSSSKEEEDIEDINVVECDQNPWLYSKQWEVAINEIYKEKKIDILHIHGVWLYPQYMAAKFAEKNKIPFILTPHGMYEPWIWKNGSLKKKMYFNFLSKRVFSKANVIHAITIDENINLKALFNKASIVDIPNLIDYGSHILIDDNLDTEKYILYMGRLDPKKGVDLLIKAFARINPLGVKLKIAGPFNHYKTFLEGLINNFHVGDKVEFLGLVKGKNKAKLFKNAFVFVAPSHSEVVGMVNLEAAIYKTPVITTHQTGLDKRWNDNGGVLINPKEEELIEALKRALEWSTETRNENGEKLYNFVLENYSWEARFKDWEATYKSMI
jgi:glycosyltransferase involved in cell wall biosynthesis